MSTDDLSTLTRQRLDALRAAGARIQGPGPVTPGATTPTRDDAQTLPGQHVQIVLGHRMVDGFGVTADQAVDDALTKLGGIDPSGTVIA